MKRALAMLAFALALSGCELKLQWHDATDRGRDAFQSQRDETQCETETGFSKPDVREYDQNPAVYRAKIDAAWARVEHCMKERGWLANSPQPLEF